jgi:copper resistance protein D
LDDLIFYARAVHFAATIMAAGVVFFVVLIAEPALHKTANDARIAVEFRFRLASIAWSSIAFAVLSGAAWLVLTAASMSGQPAEQMYASGVVWIVLSQTVFGNDWLVRFVIACVLAAIFVPLFSARSARSAWLNAAAVVLAATFVGSLAFAGHAIGAQGLEGILHPAADIVHLLAASAWVGSLVPLALLLAIGGAHAAALAAARTATLRFSTLGIVGVAAILISGIVNGWYLVGSIAAFTESEYGRLLLIKIALFAVMVTIACVNRLWLTPAMIANTDLAAALTARRRLRRNAAIEAFLGAVIIAIVAVLGTLPPASHAHHHAAQALPADASFQHIHGEDGMADVTIEPGHVGTASVTIHLLNDDLEILAAQSVTLTLTAPTPAAKPITRAATLGADGEWRVDGIELTGPGNWSVTVDALLGPNKRLKLTAPIVIDPKR